MIRILICLLLSSSYMIAQKSIIRSFDGEKIAFFDEGEGFPVLLIHGFINNADSWTGTKVKHALLEKGYRVIVPDLRGNGNSSQTEDPKKYDNLAQTKDLIVLMNHLGIKKYNAIGYSRGSIVLAKLLTIEKHRINKAIIGGMGISFSDPNWDIPNAFYEGFTGNLEDFPVAKDAVTYAKSINANLQTLALQQKYQPCTQKNELAEITTEILLLNGTDDAWNGSKTELEKALPNSTLKLVPGDHNTTYRKAPFAEETMKFFGSSNAKHVLYIHGSIMEGATGNAISDEYGEYQYVEIIQKLKDAGFIVHSEIRKADTKVDQYANKVISKFEELLENDINASDIYVLGASRGALIAMLVSTKYINSNINYILMGNCNQWVVDHYGIEMHGNILSIYEATDEIGGESCEVLKATSPELRSYKEIQLNSNLGHGFLYKPLDAWFIPVVNYINN